MDLDHFNIRTQKLAETQRFYEQILGLTPGARPVQPLNGAWLYNERQAVLHLLESAPSSLATGPLDHVAFACTGLGALLGRLDREGIARLARAIPGTPFVQVQFLDPNGVMIEANFTDETLEEPSASMATDGHTHFARLKATASREVHTVTAHGITTAYERCGAGPLLLLIHGAEADRTSFAPVLPLLSQHFTCITYDQRDTGDTLNPPDDYTAADLADDAAALIASLVTSLAPKVHVWGNSYGGMVAQELALRHPQCIDSLVLGVTFQRGASALANPDLFYSLRQRQLSDPAARLELLSLFFSPHTAAHRPELVNQALQAFSARAPQSQARRSRVTQQFNSEGRLAGISARTLVLGAMQDRVIDPLNTWRIAREIPGATLTMLGGVGHALAFEAPDHTARVIGDFLRDPARG
jgi:pimeloyl-ACP methyl ester carboxylesterase/catechol 2,3-dioxygenase-like lactoylglutathione lyase family enzyme